MKFTLSRRRHTCLLLGHYYLLFKASVSAQISFFVCYMSTCSTDITEILFKSYPPSIPGFQLPNKAYQYFAFLFPTYIWGTYVLSRTLLHCNQMCFILIYYPSLAPFRTDRSHHQPNINAHERIPCEKKIKTT